MSGLVVNMKVGDLGSKATSQKTSFDFSSLCSFNGEFYGTYSDGSIRKLGGSSNAGENIQAYLQTFKTNLGTEHDKRIRYVYLEIETDGGIWVTVSYSDTVSRTYTISDNVSGRQMLRIPVRRDDTGNLISVAVGNVSGSYLSVNEVKVLPVITPRKTNRSITVE